MSYAQPRNGTRHAVGMAAVLGFHVLLVWGLMNGLGNKVVEVLKQPLQVSLLDEVKPPPPPPPPPPKVVLPKVVTPPPPAWVPPPEVVTPPPVTPPPVTVDVTPTPPPVVEIPPPPAPPVPAPVPKPAVANISVACPNHHAVQSQVDYPPQALRQGLSGEVVVEFTVNTDGSLADINVVKTPSKVFNPVVTAAVNRLQCKGQAVPVKVRIPFVFALEN